MKGGTQAALALGLGYLLGRRRKLRRAVLLAAVTATGVSGPLGTVLGRGAKKLASTEMLGKVAPQLGDIVETVRGDLLDAGKAAAIAAVNGRVESLTDTLHDRAESLRNPADAATEAGEAVTGRLRRRRPADEDADDFDEQDMPEDSEADEPEDSEADEPEDREAEDEEPEDDEEAAPARRRPVRRRSPVARTGR
jgi:hypothetical protein